MQFRQFTVDLSSPKVMGILNITPDSFSDGGRFIAPEAAIKHAQQMVDAGAALIDIGGESTRPGAAAVSADEEMARVIPVIEVLAKVIPVPISIDTSKPEVMREAVNAGASMLNDVNGLRAEGALEAAAVLNIPVCIMHMQGEPRTMQANPTYHDVVEDIYDYFVSRLDAAAQAGLKRERIILDPGFGFGKSLAHNLSLLKHLNRFHQLESPLLVGMSRKSMIGAVTEKSAEDRLAGSVAVATMAAQMGAQIIRVHDVAETVDAIKMVNAVMQAD